MAISDHKVDRAVLAQEPFFETSLQLCCLHAPGRNRWDSGWRGIQHWLSRERPSIMERLRGLTLGDSHPQTQIFADNRRLRSLKKYQYSAEGKKFHKILAPVALVMILWNSLLLSSKWLPVLIFTSSAPRRASFSSGEKSVAQGFRFIPSPGNWSIDRSRFWEGDKTTHLSVKKRVWFFSEKGGGIQWMRGSEKSSIGKAIQWRGPDHTVNRQTLKTEKLLSSSLPKNQLLWEDPADRRKTKIFAGNHRLGSVALGQSPQALPFFRKERCLCSMITWWTFQIFLECSLGQGWVKGRTGPRQGGEGGSYWWYRGCGLFEEEVWEHSDRRVCVCVWREKGGASNFYGGRSSHQDNFFRRFFSIPG